MEEKNIIQKGPSIIPGDRISTSVDKEHQKNFTIWIGIIFFLVFIGLFIGIYNWQEKWGSYSGKVTPLLPIKKNLDTLTINELYTLGGIYETNDDYQSAEEVYKTLNKIEPNNTDFIFSLGVSFFINKKYQDAAVCFEKILSQGCLTANISYWYAKSLSALGKNTEALEWHYQTLELDDNNLSNTIEILKILTKLNKPSEGLSLIAGYTALYPNPNVIHQLKPFKIMFMKSDSTGERASFSIPEVNNQYLVPVLFSLLKNQVDFILDTGAMYMTIPLSLYKQGITPNKPTGRKVEIIGVGGTAGMGDEVILDHIEIGKIKLSNVEAIICESCPPLLGQNVLKRLGLKTENKFGKNFLTISY